MSIVEVYYKLRIFDKVSYSLVQEVFWFASVAQLIEHRFRKAGVDSLILSTGSCVPLEILTDKK